MAIQKITAQEYQKKYGVQPFSTSTLHPEEKRTIAQKIGGFLGIENFAKGIGEAAGSIGNDPRNAAAQNAQASEALIQQAKKLPMGDPRRKQLLAQSMNTAATASQGAQESLDAMPSNRQVVGGALNTAALFAPGTGKGASLGTKVLAGAGTGYAFDVGSKLQNKEIQGDDAFKPGVGTVVGGALPVLGAIFGKVNPKRLEEINLRMTPAEKQAMMKQGKDIPDYLAKKRIVGTPEVRYEKVKGLYNAMEDKVDDVIKNSGAKFSKQEVLRAIQELPEEFADDIAGYDEAMSASKKLEKFIQNKTPIEVPGELLNKYKRELFKRAYSKNNSDVLNESLHAAASKFNDMLRTAVPGLEKLNDEYGKIILSKKILFKAMSRPQVGMTGKVLGTVAGAGVGAAMGGGVGVGVGGLIGEKVAENALGTATRSTIGAGLQTIMDKIPSDKLGNLQITKKALIRLLQGIYGQN